MSDRSANPPFFAVSVKPLLKSRPTSSRAKAKRVAALLVGVLAVLFLFSLSWAGGLLGGHGWLIAGAAAGYVAFVALSGTALRLWRADWEDLAPDLRVFQDRPPRSEFRRYGVSPPVTASFSARNSRFSGREDVP